MGRVTSSFSPFTVFFLTDSTPVFCPMMTCCLPTSPAPSALLTLTPHFTPSLPLVFFSSLFVPPPMLGGFGARFFRIYFLPMCFFFPSPKSPIVASVLFFGIRWPPLFLSSVFFFFHRGGFSSGLEFFNVFFLYCFYRFVTSKACHHLQEARVDRLRPNVLLWFFFFFPIP